jgi:hypothetical protein
VSEVNYYKMLSTISKISRIHAELKGEFKAEKEIPKSRSALSEDGVRRFVMMRFPLLHSEF